MEKKIFFLDTSGSTHGVKKYFENAAQAEKDIKESCEIVYYEWAVDCLSLKKDEFEKCIKTAKNNKSNSGGTKTSSIIPILEKENLKYVSEILIITDGQIDENESIITNNLLANLREKNEAFPKIVLKIFNTGSSKVDDSVVLPFTRHGNIKIEVDGENYASIEGFVRTIESIRQFIQEIDLNKLSKEENYRKNIHTQLRAMTFMSDNKDYILEANNAINKLKLSNVKPTVLDKLPKLLQDNEDIKEIISYIKSFNTTSISCLEQETSRLSNIINSYRDTKTLIFNKNNLANQNMPSQTPIETESLTDINNEKSGFIECPITFDRGIPFLVCNKRTTAIFNELKKNALKQVFLNPLLVLKYCQNDLENMFASFFCFDPSMTNYIDPRTRQDFKDDDDTILCLTLGVTKEQIKYTDSILLRLFANDSKVCDPDFLFMSIWYHIKYLTKRDYLKELVPAFEAQLKERFQKNSFLSMNTNTYENLNKAAKFSCVWYVIHELPYLNQNDQSHSSILRYLASVDVFYAFLNDIFSIKVSSKVKEYLKKYTQMIHLKKFKNTSDAEEFWRIIASLKNDFIKIDASNSVIQLSKDQEVTKVESKANFNNDTKTNLILEFNRKATFLTIPIDIMPNEDKNKKDSSSKFSELVKDFPKSIQTLTPDEIIYLALIIFERNELYFEDDTKNKTIIDEAIKGLGFDPYDSSPNWHYYDSSFSPLLNPETLRPQKIVNGQTWHHEARKLIGINKRFISFYRHIGDFVIEKKKIPTLDEFILFIYKKEISGKQIEISFKKQFGKQNPKDSEYFDKTKRKNVSKLKASTFDNAKEVLESFSKASEGLTIDEMIKRLSVLDSDGKPLKNHEFYFSHEK